MYNSKLNKKKKKPFRRRAFRQRLRDVWGQRAASEVQEPRLTRYDTYPFSRRPANLLQASASVLLSTKPCWAMGGRPEGVPLRWWTKVPCSCGGCCCRLVPAPMLVLFKTIGLAPPPCGCALLPAVFIVLRESWPPPVIPGSPCWGRAWGKFMLISWLKMERQMPNWPINPNMFYILVKYVKLCPYTSLHEHLHPLQQGSLVLYTM